MTGDRFRRLREELGFTLRELAERWGVHNRTINREEQKDEVRGLYRDAILCVKRLHEGAEGKKDDREKTDDEDDDRRETGTVPSPRH